MNETDVLNEMRRFLKDKHISDNYPLIRQTFIIGLQKKGIDTNKLVNG